MTGKGKARKDISKGLAKSEEFTNKAVAQQQPFAQAGTSALNQLLGFAGLGTPEDREAATNAFMESLFYKGGETAFQNTSDRVNDSFAGQGLAFSGANMEAKEKARQGNFQNAFNSFLNNSSNITGVGANAATNTSNLYAGQGANALNAYMAKANTRQGVLGGLQQFGATMNTLFPQRMG